MTNPSPSRAARVRLALLAVASAICLPLPSAFSQAAPGSFKDHLGLQLWSLRAESKNNPLAALDLVNHYGLTEVETAGTGGLPVDSFAQALRTRRLNAVSAHVGYGQFEANLDGVIKDAKALGVTYVIVPILNTKDGDFDADRVAQAFNRWGAALKANGLAFGYHTHGIEFKAMADGKTRFQILMEKTDPALVSFEMDVFWVAHAGVDPTALLKRYPGRWTLMHLKDLRVGALKNGTADASAADNVPVGKGQVDWPSVLAAAKTVGIQHYFIEDETSDPLACIPASLEYLRSLPL